MPRFFDPELPAGNDVYLTCEDELSEGSAWSSSVQFEGTLDPMQVDATNTCYRRMCAISDDHVQPQQSGDSATAVVESDGVRQVGGGAVLSLYCGAGKTVCALQLMSRFRVKTLVVVHKTFLMNQWKERIAKFLPHASVGIIQKEKVDIEGHDVVLAMLQSLALKTYATNVLDQFGLCVVDECHHVSAPVFSSFMWTVPSRYVLGLSATPMRKDGLTCVMNWFLGPVVYSRTRSDENSLEVSVLRVKLPMSSRAGAVGSSNLFKAELLTRLSENAVRNEIIIDKVVTCVDVGRKVLVLSDRRTHLEVLKAILEEREQHITSAYYMGGMKAAALHRAVQCTVLFGTYSMSSEGLDIPSLDTVVFATPRTDIVQSVGRIVRQHEDKCDPLIIDIDDQHATFRAGWKKRLNFYRKHSYAIQEESYQKHSNSKDSENSSSESSDASASLDDDDDDEESLPGDAHTSTLQSTYAHRRRNRVTGAAEREERDTAQELLYEPKKVTKRQRGRPKGTKVKGRNEVVAEEEGCDDAVVVDDEDRAFINDDSEDLGEVSDASYRVEGTASSESDEDMDGDYDDVGTRKVARHQEKGAKVSASNIRGDSSSEADLRIGVTTRQRLPRDKLEDSVPSTEEVSGKTSAIAGCHGDVMSVAGNRASVDAVGSSVSDRADVPNTLEKVERPRRITEKVHKPNKQRGRRRRGSAKKKAAKAVAEAAEQTVPDEDVIDSDDESAVPCGDQWKAAESSDDQWNGSDSASSAEDQSDDKESNESAPSDSDADSPVAEVNGSARGSDRGQELSSDSTTDSSEEYNESRSLPVTTKAHLRSRSKRSVVYTKRRAITSLEEYRAKTDVTPRKKTKNTTTSRTRKVLDRRKSEHERAITGALGDGTVSTKPINTIKPAVVTTVIDEGVGSGRRIPVASASGSGVLAAGPFTTSARERDGTADYTTGVEDMHETKRARFEKVADDGKTVSKFF